MGEMGGDIYGPYTGRWFESTMKGDIEYIVAGSGAHDSGLCAADTPTREQFASYLLNLTLASPNVNRDQVGTSDAAEWLPELNQCWYADRIVQVRLKYSLSVVQREADALDSVLNGCASVEMVIIAEPTPTPASEVDALVMWNDNGNGRISCAEARRHGIAPVRRGQPVYEYMSGRDSDGIVCE